MKIPQWTALRGRFEEGEHSLTYYGENIPILSANGTPSPSPSVGLALIPRTFVGGRVSATITFASIDYGTGCELVLYYEPATGAMVVAGICPGPGLFAIRHWDGQRWHLFRVAGDRGNFKQHVPYVVDAEVAGSRVTLMVNGVQALAADLPISIFETQVGVWCVSSAQIQISDFEAQGHQARAFVVMQFTSPYNELYEEVIRGVCEEFDLDVVRADEEYGPGLIVADIAQQLAESSVVIADITPPNPNVYYEVGYAHALNKPTILLAEASVELPFDVAPHRVLLYENTIQGKSRFEERLRKHLQAILRDAVPASWSILPSAGWNGALDVG